MIQDIKPKQFDNSFHDRQPDSSGIVLIYQGRKAFLRTDADGMLSYPSAGMLERWELTYIYLFRIDEEEYYLGLPEMSIRKQLEETLGQLGFTYEDPWIFRSAVPRDRAYAGITGWQLADWYDSRRYCGSCGSRTERDKKERMIRCPDCGRTYYPTICPAVIVAVTHNGKILMSKYRDRQYRRFALIAGFNETGESIEATVHREVMEEVGVPVKNLRFYKSQPWPFSDSLLMGFFCELDGDEETITLDQNELSEAGWYPPEDVPVDFEHCALTSEMMTVFREAGGYPKI